MITVPAQPMSPFRRAPDGLSIFAGLVGLVAAIGAGLSGFLPQLSNVGRVDFYWGDALPIAATVALAGAALALAQHEAGPALLASAGTVIAVVVVTTVTSTGFQIDNLTDAYSWRGSAFLVAGAAGALAAVLGLSCLRGRGAPGIGVVTALLSVGVLACHAILVRLDARQEGFVVRPFVGVVVIVAVMVLGAFIGRTGGLATAAGATCLFPIYSRVAETDANDRQEFAVLAAAALALALALAVVAAAAAARRAQALVIGSPLQPGWNGGYDVTQVHLAQPQDPGTDAQPNWAVSNSDPTQQFEAVPSGGRDSSVSDAAFGQPTSAGDARVSGQWSPDPYGRHQMRYWDGEQWTAHVSDGGVGNSDPL